MQSSQTILTSVSQIWRGRLTVLLISGSQTRVQTQCNPSWIPNHLRSLVWLVRLQQLLESKLTKTCMSFSRKPIAWNWEDTQRLLLCLMSWLKDWALQIPRSVLQHLSGQNRTRAMPVHYRSCENELRNLRLGNLESFHSRNQFQMPLSCLSYCVFTLKVLFVEPSVFTTCFIKQLLHQFMQIQCSLQVYWLLHWICKPTDLTGLSFSCVGYIAYMFMPLCKQPESITRLAQKLHCNLLLWFVFNYLTPFKAQDVKGLSCKVNTCELLCNLTKLSEPKHNHFHQHKFMLF